MVDAKCRIVKDYPEEVTVRCSRMANFVTKPWYIRLDQTHLCSSIIGHLKHHYNSSASKLHMSGTSYKKPHSASKRHNSTVATKRVNSVENNDESTETLACHGRLPENEQKITGKGAGKLVVNNIQQ